MTVAVGQRAPDFTLPSTNGAPLTLSTFFNRSTVVLFFYPQDDTPGCTAEACAFRDMHEAFAAAGAEVIGISSDSIASHEDFARKHRLGMALVSDAGGAVRALYGVRATLGLIPGRVTFVIDKTGTVRHVFVSQFRVKQHVNEALEIVKKLEASGSSQA